MGGIDTGGKNSGGRDLPFKGRAGVGKVGKKGCVAKKKVGGEDPWWEKKKVVLGPKKNQEGGKKKTCEKSTETTKRSKAEGDMETTFGGRQRWGGTGEKGFEVRRGKWNS